jgi:hypothetical protein
MDTTRLRKLAGMDTGLMEQYEASAKELDLLEKIYQGKYNLDIDTGVMPIEEIQKRLDAASRALGIANRLRDPEYKKQHLSRIMSNMNTIRAALSHMIKQAEQPQEPPM